MKCEPDVIEHAAELLREITGDGGPLTPKRLAALTDRDLSTIYRYLNGEKTIPSIVLRAAFEDTLDPRIVQLISGRVAGAFIIATDRPGVFVCACCASRNDSAGRSERPVRTPPQPAAPPPVEQLVPTACESVKQTADALAYIAKITADGLIDASDDTAIANFKKHAAAAQRDLSLLTAALDHQRRAAK